MQVSSLGKTSLARVPLTTHSSAKQEEGVAEELNSNSGMLSREARLVIFEYVRRANLLHGDVLSAFCIHPNKTNKNGKRFSQTVITRLCVLEFEPVDMPYVKGLVQVKDRVRSVSLALIH